MNPGDTFEVPLLNTVKVTALNEGRGVNPGDTHLAAGEHAALVLRSTKAGA